MKPSTQKDRPYNLRFSKEQLLAMRDDPALVFQLPLNPPHVQDGETFRWRVDPVRVTADLKIIPRGQGVLCRDDAEATREARRLRDEAVKEFNERPLPGKQTILAEIIGVHRAQVRCIPISQFAAPTIPPRNAGDTDLPADEPFADIGHVFWQGSDNSGQAALGILRSHQIVRQVYRVIVFKSPLRGADGILRKWGVERLEIDSKGTPVTVLTRELFTNEAEAMNCFDGYRKQIPQERIRLLGKPADNKDVAREDAQLKALRKLAQTHDRSARASHERRIAEILAARAKREQEASVKKEAADEQTKQLSKAQSILLKQLFPELHRFKGERRDLPEDRRKEGLRRALAIDCKRLKITSPFNHGFTIDADFLSRLQKAARARSPADPHEIEVVLNWLAKKYNSLTAQARARKVSQAVGTHVSATNLKRTVARKYGLKTGLKGRTPV